jgi:hypothetical protein
MGVFFSFHYERDSWRVQQIINMGVIEGQPLLNAQDWESIKRKGDQAIKNWIADQMKYKTALVVMIGAQTAPRPWVWYEIAKAWDDKRRLVGIRIHRLADKNGKTDSEGTNPFLRVSLQGGGTVSDYVPVFNPSGGSSQQVHANIKANLVEWIERGYKRS